MTKWALLILTACVQWSAAGCALRSGGASDLRKAEQLATEQGRRVYDLKEPVAKTKSYIKISEILLDFAAEAAKRQDTRLLTTRLNQYATAVRAARDTMLPSQQKAKQRPQGFRDLERALGTQIGRLEGIIQGLSADQRQPLNAAIEVAKMIRNEMQRALSLPGG